MTVISELDERVGAGRGKGEGYDSGEGGRRNVRLRQLSRFGCTLGNVTKKPILLLLLLLLIDGSCEISAVLQWLALSTLYRVWDIT